MFKSFRDWLGQKAGSGGIVGGVINSFNRAYQSLSYTARNWLKLKNDTARLDPLEKIANDVASIDLRHVDAQGNEIMDSPVIELLKKPSPGIPGTEWLDGTNLRKLTEIYTDLTGEAFWIIERGYRNKVVGIVPIPPTWVMSIPTKDKEFYEVAMLGSMGNVVRVNTKDMIYFKTPDIQDPFGRGRGYSSTIGDEIEVDSLAANHQKYVFYNNARPDMFISIDGASDTQLKDYRDQMTARFRGPKNVRKPLVANGRIQITTLEQSLKDLDMIEGRKYIRDSVMEHYFMPKEIMGINENSNRATITAAQGLYDKNALEWRIKFFVSVLNTQLIPFLAPGTKLEYVPFVTEDKEFISDQAMKEWESGLITRDMYMAKTGQEPFGGPFGNQVKSKISDIYITATTEENEPDIPQDEVVLNIVEEEKKVISIKSYPRQLKSEQLEEFKKNHWKQIDTTAESLEAPMVRDLKRFFQDQQDRFTQAFTNLNKSATDYENEEAVDEFFNIEESLALYAVLRPHWVQGEREGYTIANDTFDLAISWDVVRPEAIKNVETWGVEHAKYMNDTTRDSLKKEIEDGLREGESIPQIRKRISGVYAIAKDSRATNIARTETHNAVINGTFVSYGKAGVQRKQWLTTYDGRERASHGAIGGQVRNMNEPFITGSGNELMHPGDPNGPVEEVAQCRCALLPVFE